MKIEFRNLNTNEQYVCDKKDVKRIFSNEENLFVSFGYLGRNYNFDSKFINRPNIKGDLVCSLQVNRRLNVLDTQPILSFYVIRDEKFDKKSQKTFSDTILQKAYDWYKGVLSKTDASLPGVEVFLVEWVDLDFKIHSCRYH